jgi:hypothetical protein
MRIGNWEIPPGEEILQWRPMGREPTCWVTRVQAGMILEQLGYAYDVIEHALMSALAAGQHDVGSYRVRYDRSSGECVITRWRDPRPGEPRWDPVPHLAALIDGIHGVLEAGTQDELMRRLGELAAGPYTALRGGLLLDEPGRETVPTADALHEVLGGAGTGART